MKTLLIALLLSTSAMAQPALRPQEYDPTETYYFERPSGSYIHPIRGTEVLLVIIRAASTGKYFRVPMDPTAVEELLPGDEVILVRSEKYLDEGLPEWVP